MLKATRSYIEARLRPFPWLIIPAALYVGAYGRTPYSGEVLLYSYISVLFYRILDDFLLFSSDQRRRQDAYLEHPKVNLLPLVLMSFTIWCLSLWVQNFTKTMIVINVMALILTLVLYTTVHSGRWRMMISIVKYPIILASIASVSDATSLVWVGLFTAFFVLREYIEEFFNQRSQKIETVFIIALLLTKLSMRFS